MSPLSDWRRRRRRRKAVARVLRVWAALRIAFGAVQAYRRARPVLRFARWVTVTAIVLLVARRLGRRSRPATPEPFVAAVAEPSSNGVHTPSGRDLEKDAG